MRVLDLAIYSDKEFTTLYEAKKKFSPNAKGWSVKESSAFKKVFKKYG